MLRLIARRLASAVPLLLVATFTLFAMIDFIPGDPAVALDNGDPSLIPYIRASLHLNEPLYERYGRWLLDAIQGNLGTSYSVAHPSVTSLIGSAAPITLSVFALAIVISTVVAFTLGIIAAIRVGRPLDRVLSALFALFVATPSFWLGYLFILWFGIDLGWLPVLGYAPPSAGLWQWLSHLILPSVTLAPPLTAQVALQLRGGLIDAMGRDYILSARAKGLREWAVVGKHALKNVGAPVATVVGFQIANLLGATVIVETVFGLPGIGNLTVQSAEGRDVPTLLGLVLCTTLLVVAVNLVVDISYGYFNPKVRTA